jgi:CTP-dependent riboflavin kinase
MGILQRGQQVESKNRGFIVTYYTNFNGTKVTREDLVKKINDYLLYGPKTISQIAQHLKLSSGSTTNVLVYMVDNDMIKKTKPAEGKYLYSRVTECLLAEMFSPKPEDIEKMFKIKGRKKYTVDDGTSKSSGGHGVTYSDSYYNLNYWEDMG